MTSFDCARWSSCRGQHAACARRLGGGPAPDGLYTGLVRAPERTGDSPPRPIPRPPSLRVHQCVPSSVHVRHCLARPQPLTSSGSAFPINNGCVSQIGITEMPFERSLEIESRLDQILRLIRTGRYSTPKLAEEVGVSIPTISRCVTALRERGHDIRAEKHEGGWRYKIGDELPLPQKR
jgi:biotin operon repressor